MCLNLAQLSCSHLVKTIDIFTLWNDSPFAIRLHSGVSGLKSENQLKTVLMELMERGTERVKGTLKVIGETCCPISSLHYSALKKDGAS